MKPTLHLTNLSSRRLHGPGRLLHIQARPPAFVRAACAGYVPALAPTAEDHLALSEGRLGPIEYRQRFLEPLQGASPQWLAHGHLVFVDANHLARMVGDGDTLVCTCSRDQAAAGWCHRVWAADALLVAGWAVVLDGLRLTTPRDTGCGWCEEQPIIGCCLDRRPT